MSFLRAVLVKNGGFSQADLSFVVKLIRNTFNHNNLLNKNECINIKVTSPSLFQKHGVAMLHFRKDVDLDAKEKTLPKKTTLTDVSCLKFQLFKFAKMEKELFKQDSFSFSLTCEGVKNFSISLQFEKLSGEKVQHIFIESDNAESSRIFSETLKFHAQQNKEISLTTDPASFKQKSQLTEELFNEVFTHQPLPEPCRYMQW